MWGFFLQGRGPRHPGPRPWIRPCFSVRSSCLDCEALLLAGKQQGEIIHKSRGSLEGQCSIMCGWVMLHQLCFGRPPALLHTSWGFVTWHGCLPVKICDWESDSVSRCEPIFGQFSYFLGSASEMWSKMYILQFKNVKIQFFIWKIIYRST